MHNAGTSWRVALAPGLMWLVFVSAFTALQWSSLRALEMPDTDDYLRLHQAQEFERTAQWYRLTLERMNPPTGTELHWSRLPDLPLVAASGLLQTWLDRPTATFLTLVIVPSLILLATVYLIWAGLRFSALPPAAGIAALYLLLCLPVLVKSAPGKLDHHGWQIMLVAALWAATAMAIKSRRSWLPGIFAGIAMAVSLWIGLETLPLLLALMLFIHLEWVFGRAPMARFGRSFGVAFACASVAVLVLHTPASERLAGSCDSYAINWLWLSWLAALCCACLVVLGRRWQEPGARFACSVACASVFAVGALLVDGGCILAGPYAELPQRLHEELLAKIYEVRSGFVLARDNLALFVLLLGFPLVTLVYACIERNCLRNDAICRLSFLLALCALAMSFWQIRGAYFAGLFAVPLAAYLAQAATHGGANQTSRALLPSLVVLLLLSPVATVAAGVALERLGSGELRTPAAEVSISAIDQAIAAIDVFPQVSAEQAVLIAAPINAGPAILARSRHAVIAAPYHRNAQGILRWLDMKAAANEQLLQRLMLQAEVDFLLLPSLQSVKESASVIEQVAAGRQLPWLQQIPLRGEEDALLFYLPGS